MPREVRQRRQWQAPHSSTLAWKIPWMEEPGRLQSMGSLRVGHDWATSLSLFTFMRWRRKWQPTPVFLPGKSQGRWSLMGCHLWGHTVGHDWSNLAAAVVLKMGILGQPIAELTMVPVFDKPTKLNQSCILKRYTWENLAFCEVLNFNEDVRE